MTKRDDLEPFSDSVTHLFASLGLPNPRLMADVSRDWDDLALTPWAGRSKPVVIRGETLVVEATSPSMVAFLKYSISALVERMADRFGEGVITAVEVVPPGRQGP